MEGVKGAEGGGVRESEAEYVPVPAFEIILGLGMVPQLQHPSVCGWDLFSFPR